MIKTNINWTVKNLKNMYDAKETLAFDHPIQRQSSQWSNLQQSLLVHSILANYPVPSIYVEKASAEEAGKNIFKYSVLDGKQRLTTLFGFIDEDYALNENTPDVQIDGVTYTLAGKTFEELDEDVRQELLRYKFSILAFEDCTDDEVEEIFFRLNNSTPLTKPQKSRPLMGVDNAKFINQILSDDFFVVKCNFSALQLRKSDDMCTLLQAMMLLDNKYTGYEYSSISADETMRYAASIKNTYSNDQRAILTTTLNYLNEAFPSKEKFLKKINIPMVVMVADLAITKGIAAYDFCNWLRYFFISKKEEYSQFCSSGSIKKEKVLGRLSIMQDHFMEHFHIDENVVEESVDETIVEEVAEVTIEQNEDPVSENEYTEVVESENEEVSVETSEEAQVKEASVENIEEAIEEIPVEITEELSEVNEEISSQEESEISETVE